MLIILPVINTHGNTFHGCTLIISALLALTVFASEMKVEQNICRDATQFSFKVCCTLTKCIKL